MQSSEKQDGVAWDRVVASRYLTNEWSPELGKFPDNDASPFAKPTYSYIFVASEHGTQKGARLSAPLSLRKLFAVTYSIISDDSDHRLLKCGAEPHTRSIQFPENGTSGLGITTSGIGTLVSYYTNDTALESAQITMVQDWFLSQSSLAADKSNRVDKCAYFANRAMNSSDIEAYVKFFRGTRRSLWD